MWHSTRGIVFHTVKYSDTSLIVRVYTELFGLQSYLARGVRKGGSRVKAALFQPLSLLTLEVSVREQQSLQHFREVSLAVPYLSIPYDIRKSTVALFINELVYKSIREEEPNPALFEFLWEQSLLLDSEDVPAADFPLAFTLDFMHHLGIFPRVDHSAGSPYFDLREGSFSGVIPSHPDYLDPEQSAIFAAILRRERKRAGWALGILMDYYKMHLPGFKGVESLKILKEVFHG
jgi:DNA repair protein RecO (recombination protein O)